MFNGLGIELIFIRRPIPARIPGVLRKKYKFVCFFCYFDFDTITSLRCHQGAAHARTIPGYNDANSPAWKEYLHKYQSLPDSIISELKHYIFDEKKQNQIIQKYWAKCKQELAELDAIKKKNLIIPINDNNNSSGESTSSTEKDDGDEDDGDSDTGNDEKDDKVENGMVIDSDSSNGDDEEYINGDGDDDDDDDDDDEEECDAMEEDSE
jgi:hypothetical protein